MTYNEWEESQPISPVSPEAYYAELAWNAAAREALRLLKDANYLNDQQDLLITLEDELTHLDTGFTK